MDIVDDRNVSDCFKGKPDEEIISELDDSRLDLVVMTENVSGDFHKANILRTAEGFNINSFYIVGEKKWDRRAAVGSHHRMAPRHFTNFEQAVVDASRGADYKIVAVDNVPGSVSMETYCWQPKTIMIFGEEQRGLSQEALDSADDVVYIPMRGAVRSFSVSTAAGIAMYDYYKYMRSLKEC